MLQEHTAGAGRRVWSTPCRGGTSPGHDAERGSGQRKRREQRDGAQGRRAVCRKGGFPGTTVLERQRGWDQMATGSPEVLRDRGRHAAAGQGATSQATRGSMPPVPRCTGPAGVGGARGPAAACRGAIAVPGVRPHALACVCRNPARLGCHPAVPATGLLRAGHTLGHQRQQ